MATKEAREAARHKYRQFLAGKGWPTSLDVQAHWELFQEEDSGAAGGSKELPKEPGAGKARSRSRSGSKSSSAGKQSPTKKAKE